MLSEYLLSAIITADKQTNKQYSLLIMYKHQVCMKYNITIITCIITRQWSYIMMLIYYKNYLTLYTMWEDGS